MAESAILGEKFTSKVSAEFDNLDDARVAAWKVGHLEGIDASQIRIVEPNDPAMARKLEPESAGIARSLVRTHVIFGLAGLVAGLLAGLLGIVLEVDALSQSPRFTLFVTGFFGAVAGLLLGGLVSLRPDHDHMITEVSEASNEGHWFVLVHVRDQAEKRNARETLEALSKRVGTTL